MAYDLQQAAALRVLQQEYQEEPRVGRAWRFVATGRAWFWRCCGQRGYTFQAFYTQRYPTGRVLERRGVARTVCGVCGALNNID